MTRRGLTNNRAWVDVFLLGVAFVVFAQWYTTCRRTDRKISQLLVVSRLSHSDYYHHPSQKGRKVYPSQWCKAQYPRRPEA